MFPGLPRTRRRYVGLKPRVIKTGTMFRTHNGQPTGNWVPLFENTANYELPFTSCQVTMDSVHLGPPYLSGSPFRSLRYDVDPSSKQPYQRAYGIGTYLNGDKTQKYVGGFAPPPRGSFHPLFAFDDFDFEGRSADVMLAENSPAFPSMGDWGDKAWAKTRPKLEKASGYVFLREGRDIPRMLQTTSAGFHAIWEQMRKGTPDARNYFLQRSWLMQPKKAADQFLNQQFGWLPFINDLLAFNKVIQNYSEIEKKSSERNGKWTRRRVTLKSEETNQILKTGLAGKCSPGLWNPAWCTPNAHSTLSERIVTTVSAVGVFKYYRPEFDLDNPKYHSAWNTSMRSLTTFGLRVNPSNLYKATPWTWAIDWFTNMGDHIDHLNDIIDDSVANKYLYVMQHKTTSRVYRETYPFTSSGTLSLEFERVIDSKQRQEGTSPYGFSLSGDLTPRQLAIALALGVTRT